jgi:RimJ/RimL family protein N-acetyltransferase
MLTLPIHIQSRRLLIRTPTPADAEAMQEAITESLPELQRWMPWAQEPLTLEAQRERLAGVEARQQPGGERPTDLAVLLFELETGELVGASGLHRIDWSVPSFEIGYWLRTRRTGEGLMTEAVVALAAHAFEELNALRVEIRTSTRNQASRRVAERAGFTQEAILRQDSREVDGTLRDTVIYTRIREQA